MASERLDMAEQLELERALEESRRTFEEEEVRRRRSAAKTRQAASLPPPEPVKSSSPSSCVVMRRPAPRSHALPRPGSVGRIQPPPSAASTRRGQLGGDLMRFEEDKGSRTPNSRDSGDWKSSGSFYDELESILSNGSGGQNRASG